MKIIIILTILITIVGKTYSQKFSSDNFENRELRTIEGKIVKYKSYEKVKYCTKTDTLHCLNIYVPENVKDNAPILLQPYTHNFRSSTLKLPNIYDATGLALSRGMVVCVPMLRGCNSFDMQETIVKEKRKKEKTFNIVYNGYLPAPLIDLKAVVRFLKANDSDIPGNSEKIIANGFGSAGALVVMLGLTGNDEAYKQQPINDLQLTNATDDVWAVACYSPKIDFNQDEKNEFSTDFRNYIYSLVVPEMKTAMSNGAYIPEYMGAEYFVDNMTDDLSEYLIDFNVDTYIEYLRKNATPIKFSTIFGATNSENYQRRIEMMDPLRYLSNGNQPATKRWFVRHGSYDTEATIFATARLLQLLKASDCNINLAIPWSVGHAGDYDLEELLEWSFDN